MNNIVKGKFFFEEKKHLKKRRLQPTHAFYQCVWRDVLLVVECFYVFGVWMLYRGVLPQSVSCVSAGRSNFRFFGTSKIFPFLPANLSKSQLG